MARGFVYLVAIMDWHSRRVLSWRVCNTLDTSFCIEALEEAIEEHGVPEIFNTDQGSQFTSEEFTGMLKQHGIQISMDGKGVLGRQCLRRAAVAQCEVRGCIPESR
jgi:putative transposase